jgi:uncharacterized protein YqeY
MSVKEKIQTDMKDAMRARDSKRLGVVRLILAAIKQREVDERIVLDDPEVFLVLDKMLKQRRDSLEQYQAANRSDLADQEAYEIDLIQAYLPAALSETEIEELIQSAISEIKAVAMQDMGKVMAVLKPKIQGRADVGLVSQKVKHLLGAK